MRIKIASLLTLLMILSDNSFCQKYDLSTPEGTIKALFTAMYDGDGDLAKLVFTDNASLNSVFTTKEGELKVQDGDVAGFIDAIGTPHEEVWDERISGLQVKTDGDLAQAWMNYSFFLGENFSHCGVNSMHLIRKSGEWKIFQIVDTRRKTGCK